MDKQLKEKAIDIKGKLYVQVSDRVVYFNDAYPNGCINTILVSDVESNRIIIKAMVIPDVKEMDRAFTGYAQEVIGDGFINKTSALENAETSAVGRALAMMGIGVLDSIASVDEITKAENRMKMPVSKTEDKFAKSLDLDLKRTIKELVEKLAPELAKEDYKTFIEEETKEKLVPANFTSIINKLTILLEERK
jgi:hypothetical protein